jgi:hypothetical protein
MAEVRVYTLAVPPGGPGPGQPARRPTDVLVWVGLLIVAVMVLGAAILVLRRNVLSRGGPADQSPGFMEDLRRMRDRGEITPEEFEAARRAMIARIKGGERAPPPKSG